MKNICLALLIICLTACDNHSQNVTSNYSVPSELNDCKIFRVVNTSGNVLYVTRCPNSSTTTYVAQKNGVTTTVLDAPIVTPPKPKVTIIVNGVTYVKEEK